MQGNNNSKLRLLISTDNHLGYLEKDTIRGEDSFRAFEEVLKIAKEEQVDAIILGGDLFHENKPSRKCIHRTMELLRHYCMGDGQVEIELLSDATQNFPSLFGTANWEDPNFNIAIPVFTIHGNHDDPTGDGSLSSLDLLSTAGLLNYFGKSPTVDDITMNPILLRKGTTKLALYGLGSIRDERLHRTFLQSKVRMLRPPGADKDYFSILLFHQNRAAHSPTNHIPENFLDDFLDLIVWGHEHECLATEDQEMMEAPQRGHQVLQLGSSVHTSLSEGESKPKCCMVADIEGRSFSLKRRPLLSVRPFLIRNISLQKHFKTIRPLKEVEEYLKSVVEEQLLSSTLASTAQMLPLLRLRVDYSYDDTKSIDSINLVNIADRCQYPLPNTQRFGLYFQDRLANTKDIILPLRRSIKSVKKSGGADAKNHTFANQQGSKTKMEDLVQDCLALNNNKNNNNTDSPLQLLPVNEFMDVVKRSVEKDDRDLIGDFVKGSLKEMRMHLLPTVPSAIDGLEGFIDDAPMDPLVMRERMDSWRSKKDCEFSSSFGGSGGSGIGASNIEKKKTLDVIGMDIGIDINDGTKDSNDDDNDNYDAKNDDDNADKDDIKQQDIDVAPPSPLATTKKRAVSRTRATEAASTSKTTKTAQQPSAKKVKKSWPPARS